MPAWTPQRVTGRAYAHSLLRATARDTSRVSALERRAGMGMAHRRRHVFIQQGPEGGLEAADPFEVLIPIVEAGLDVPYPP